MAKKKNSSKAQQQHLSPITYLRTRARSLEIGKCYYSSDMFDPQVGIGYVLVSRNHTGGKVSFACFTIDVFCLGLKDSFYSLREDPEVIENLIEDFSRESEMEECGYEVAHNIIYGAIAFAEEAGIEPHHSFGTTQYMLEEDTDDIPIIEYEFGKNGEHFYIASSRDEMKIFLPKLEKALGNNFKYQSPKPVWGYDDSDYEKAPTYGQLTPYTYNPPVYCTELKLHNPWVAEELNSGNSMWIDDDTVDRILALPREELREDLENIIMYYTTLTRDGVVPPELEEENPYVIVCQSVMLLAEVGNDSSSLDVVLELLRQSPDFHDYHFGDFIELFVTPTLLKLGKNKLGVLLDFMKEPGLYTFSKSIVPDMVSQLAIYDPSRRYECIEWFKQLIDFAIDVLPGINYIDSSLAGLITSNVLDLRDASVLPRIEAMFATGCVDQGAVGTIDQVKREFDETGGTQPEFTTTIDIHERFHIVNKEQ